jgi:CRISPR-associated endoribonuclease Cas6
MTCILEKSMTKPLQMAGLMLVLRPQPPSQQAIALSDWLPADSPQLFWLALTPKQGMIKVMPVLASITGYPDLFQVICQQLTQTNQIEWQGRYYEITGVETLTDELFAIQFMVSHQQALPASLNRAIHGMCLQWFANTDLELANQLHQAAASPFTTSAWFKNRQQLQVKITVLQAELLTALLWGLCPSLGQELTITDVPCQLSSHLHIIASSSYQKLSQLEVKDAVELEFLTPTSFKQDQFIQPFPLPHLVFGGLLRRWNQFVPEQLRFERIEWSGLVAEYELKTHAFRMKTDEIGAQGWVRYRFLDPEQASVAIPLAHFATFAGVGRKTALGMGQTRLRQHKP